jgi:hypothetical protein
MGKVAAAPRAWYFRDGTPFNPEVIGRIVSKVVTRSAGKPDEDPVTEALVRATARYFASRIERNLVQMLLAEIDSFRRKGVPSSGNAQLDAKRRWRRVYMRQYRTQRDETRP